MTKNERANKGKLFYFLLGTCFVLAILCACLLAAIVLLRHHFSACDLSVGERESVTKQASGVVSAMESRTQPWEVEYRLPPDTTPEFYDILLHPDLDNSTFSGEVTIRINVKAPRSFLVVHTKNLNIYETRLSLITVGETTSIVVNSEEEDVKIKEAFEYKPNEFWVVQTEKNLEPGKYHLRMKFKGNLDGKIIGFYRSVYTDKTTNKKRTIASSKFQPTYARQAYPCFDEPSFKAQFKVRLVRPNDGYIALSNMDQQNEVANTPETGLTTVEFQTSEYMVTYLSCFIVCDFKRLGSISIANQFSPDVVFKANAKIESFPFSVYSTPHQVQKTKYALDTGVKIIKYYIDYFGVPYPLPKLDLIAIPDFVSGAMEHWGIVTFRETNLLYEEGISSTANKKRVATVIGHELAHMWFGNLVTMEWWNDLWLNEGFASYIECKGVNHAHPDWKMMDQFLIDDLHSVMVLDSLVTSHPIVQAVAHPDEITSLFDTISYQKGSSVIRMLEDFMGEDQFRLAVKHFLTQHQFKGAVTQDFYDAVQIHLSNNVNATNIMDTWTRQMGYPVVTAERQLDGKVTLTQNRFLLNPDANVSDDSPYGYKWHIPITYITSESKIVKRDWFYADNTSVTIEVPENVAWYKINSHQKGFYRVNYDEENWKQLSEVLMNDLTALDVADRAHLVEDVFNLAEAELVSYNLAMDMTKYLTAETEYVPWSVAASKFSYLEKLLSSSTSYPELRKYVQSLVLGIYNKVTLKVSEDDSHSYRLLRPTIVNLACKMGLEECINEVVSMFKNWIINVDETPKPHPDIRTAVYKYGIKYAGGEKEWDIMWNLFLKETDAQEKVKLSIGLAFSSEPWILQRYLQLAKIESNVRSQDFFTVLSYISANPIGNPLTWDFIRDEWEYLVKRFTLNDRIFGRSVLSITSAFASELKLKEMEAFFLKYPEAGAGKEPRRQALEKVRKNIKWLARHKKTLEDWLNSKN